MKRDSLLSIVQELKSSEYEWPAGLQLASRRLEQQLATQDDEQVSLITDGVVSVPAGQRVYDQDDINLLVQELYEQLDAFIANRRAQGTDEQLMSILNRLRGEVDTYERDFP